MSETTEVTLWVPHDAGVSSPTPTVPVVYAALLEAQLAVGNVDKRSDGKTAYQQADEVMLVAKTALLGAGLAFRVDMSTPITEQIVLPSKNSQGDGVKQQMLVTATLTVYHPDDGSSLSFRATGVVLANNMGLYGAVANTRARKQAFLSALGITTGENHEAHREPEPEPEPEPVPPEVEELLESIEQAGTRAEIHAIMELDDYKGVRGRHRVWATHALAEFWISQLGAAQNSDDLRKITAEPGYMAIRRGAPRERMAAAGSARLAWLKRLDLEWTDREKPRRGK